jgi:hypothetical protein
MRPPSMRLWILTNDMPAKPQLLRTSAYDQGLADHRTTISTTTRSSTVAISFEIYMPI